MTLFFNHWFTHTNPEFLQDVYTLETEGVLYNNFWSDEQTQSVRTRVRLTTPEVVEFVEAAISFDEFNKLLSEFENTRSALNKLTNERIREQVLIYNRWAEKNGELDLQYCFAAFLGDNLEGLCCSIIEDRHEVLTNAYTNDRRFLLEEILEMFVESAHILNSREANRPAFHLEQELDVRDLLYAIIKGIFPDTRIEEFTPKLAGKSKRIDVVIPKLFTVIEVKFVRTKQHASKVADELMIDFESYHNHQHCKTLIAFVWDPNHYISDRHNFIKELKGLRVKNNNRFTVDVLVKP